MPTTAPRSNSQDVEYAPRAVKAATQASVLSMRERKIKAEVCDHLDFGIFGKSDFDDRSPPGLIPPEFQPANGRQSIK